MIEVLKTVTTQSPAITLFARNAVGSPSEVIITWWMLRESEIGCKWRASGGGSLFADSQEATLVYRDDECAVLMVHSEYEDRDRSDVDTSLRGFRF